MRDMMPQPKPQGAKTFKQWDDWEEGYVAAKLFYKRTMLVGCVVCSALGFAGGYVTCLLI